MREQQVQSWLLANLRKLGGWWTNTQGTAYTTRGTPDILGVYRGRFYGVEVKASGGRATEIQKHTLELIAQAGGKALVVSGLDGAKAFVASLQGEKSSG